MRRDKRDLLEVLKFELEFLEKGGYGRSPRTPWRPQFIFEDSPTCMNYDSKDNPGPCSDCVLMQLVPAERRGEKIPCRHFPLNPEGETVDSLYRYGNQEELEDNLRTWLRATIHGLEQEQKSERNHDTEAEEIRSALSKGQRTLDVKAHAGGLCSTDARKCLEAERGVHDRQMR
ncbi:MAG TPA: hypothetical protein VKE24_04760 [Candidatus Acidoferrales bacterium]|nr:hypothetical protein [Candidatus Acidoferrales bacterium]